MARGLHKLSAKGVEKTIKPGVYADGGGLCLQISQWQTKAWLFRFMRDGRARKMGLGPLHTVSLAKARDEALACRLMLREGIDPIEARKTTIATSRATAAKLMTFRQCAETYISTHASSWKNAKHAAQWSATLKAYAYPILGEIGVRDIDVGLVLKVLEPIWYEKPETAGRVRGRIETVLDWAAVRAYRERENPARWKGYLQNALPARSKVAKVKHHAALPYADLPAFMAELRGSAGVSSRALEFAILTASRTGEVIGARWEEIDLSTRMWSVPSNRMKSGREHRVPLTESAIKLLAALPHESDFIFIGNKPGKPLSNMALLMTLRRMGRPDITAHGFRSTFRDWAAECTAHPSEVCEMALAHVVADKVEAAYRRGDLLGRRRRLMSDWAEYAQSQFIEGTREPALDLEQP